MNRGGLVTKEIKDTLKVINYIKITIISLLKIFFIVQNEL